MTLLSAVRSDAWARICSTYAYVPRGSIAGVGGPGSSRRLVLALDELWRVMSSAKLTRDEDSEPVLVTQIANRPASIDEEFVAAAARRAGAAYRAWACRRWVARIRARAVAAWDGETGRSTACLIQVLRTDARGRLTLCELPRVDAARPYSYRLGERGLLLVLDGHPTLATAQGRRELRRDDAVALLPDSNRPRQLVADGTESVRFLEFSPAAHPSPAP
jgi:hypothetical protein